MCLSKSNLTTIIRKLEVKIYIYIPSSQTKGTIKIQKTKGKTITGNKETQTYLFVQLMT